MLYQYANQKVVTQLRKECETILKGVQKEVSEFFTFQFYLIGSGEKKLVTQGCDGYFDLDYNLVLMSDKQGLASDPKRVKDIFIKAFNDVAPKLGFSFAKNSTSVITSKHADGDNHFSFDCAIVAEGNNGNFYKIVFDKPDRYIWNEIKHTKDFNAKFQFLRANGYLDEIKKLYLKKKNANRSGASSFAILSQTVNEIVQEYGSQ